MPKVARKRWTHRFDGAEGNIPSTATTGSFRDLEKIDGVTNYLRTLKDLKFNISMAMEVPTSGGTDECRGVLGLIYREKSLGATEVSYEDTQAFWRPVPWTMVGPESTSNGTIAFRTTIRWNRITIPENYTLAFVVLPFHQDSDVHYSLQAHWLEARKSM